MAYPFTCPGQHEQLIYSLYLPTVVHCVTELRPYTLGSRINHKVVIAAQIQLDSKHSTLDRFQYTILQSVNSAGVSVISFNFVSCGGSSQKNGMKKAFNMRHIAVTCHSHAITYLCTILCDMCACASIGIRFD